MGLILNDTDGTSPYEADSYKIITASYDHPGSLRNNKTQDIEHN